HGIGLSVSNLVIALPFACRPRLQARQACASGGGRAHAASWCRLIWTAGGGSWWYPPPSGLRIGSACDSVGGNAGKNTRVRRPCTIRAWWRRSTQQRRTSHVTSEHLRRVRALLAVLLVLMLVRIVLAAVLARTVLVQIQIRRDRRECAAGGRPSVWRALETVEHFLHFCSAHAAARRELHKAGRLARFTKHLLTDPKLLPDLFHYIQRSGRFHAVFGDFKEIPRPDDENK
ncbi:hypothetical protein C8J57DRAFT_1332690, partial [Mycena rebaudengoi]